MLIYSQMTVVTPPSHLYRIPISNPHIRICHAKIPRVGIGTEELHAFPRRVRKDVMQVELLVVPVGLRCSGVGACLGGSAHGQCAREGCVDGGASSVAGIVGIFHIACAEIVFVICDWATKGVDNDNFTGAGCAT